MVVVIYGKGRVVAGRECVEGGVRGRHVYVYSSVYWAEGVQACTSLALAGLLAGLLLLVDIVLRDKVEAGVEAGNSRVAVTPRTSYRVSTCLS